MLVNSSDNAARRRSRRWVPMVVLPLWVLVSFGLSQIIIVVVFHILRASGASFAGVNETVFNTVVAAVVYVLTLAIVIGVPWAIKKYITTPKEIGLTRLPSWMDIGLAPAGYILYLIISAILLYAVGFVFPGIDMNQTQETGFSNLTYYYEYLLAFVTLVVVAPVAEEVLFRGYLYGKLRKSFPVWVVTLIVSAVFGLVHAQWNVGIDVFALSIILCSLREMTGSIWAGILLHMIKNGLAFYLLFINTDLLRTIGG